MGSLCLLLNEDKTPVYKEVDYLECSQTFDCETRVLLTDWLLSMELVPSVSDLKFSHPPYLDFVFMNTVPDSLELGYMNCVHSWVCRNGIGLVYFLDQMWKQATFKLGRAVVFVTIDVIDNLYLGMQSA